MLLRYYVIMKEEQILDRVQELTDKYYDHGLTIKEDEELAYLASKWETEFNK